MQLYLNLFEQSSVETVSFSFRVYKDCVVPLVFKGYLGKLDLMDNEVLVDKMGKT